MSHLISVVLPLLFYSLSCLGAGILTMRVFVRRPKESLVVEMLLAFLLGQGILGSLFIFPALAGMFSVSVLLSVTIPLACWGIWHLFKTSGTARPSIGRLYREFCSGPLTWRITIAFLAFLLLAGGCSVATEVTDDARAFYMVLPKVIAASHRLVPLPLYEDFSLVGLTAEMQLAALFLLGMPGGSARLFCWLTALAGAVILLAICKRVGLGRRGQIIALSTLVTSTAVTWLWGTGKTDFFAAAFGLCAYYYALRSWDADSRKHAVLLAGLFTGFAIVAKLSYLVPFLPGVLILLYWQEMQNLTSTWRSREQRLIFLRRCTTVAMLFGAVAAMAFVPQLTKNLTLYGDALKTLGGDFQWFSPETTRRIVLSYPLVLTYGNYWGQMGNMSPLLLAFLPLALLAPYPKTLGNAPVAALITAALAGLVLWVVLFPAVPMHRYFLATLVLLIVPASWAAERFSKLGSISGHIVWAGTFLILLLFYKVNSPFFFNWKDAYRNLVAQQAEGIPSGSEVDSYPVYRMLNQIAEPGARVFTLTYFKFLLRADLIQCATRSSEIPSPLDAENPESFWRRMHSQGFTYLLAEDAYNIVAVDRLIKSKPAWVTFETIVKQGTWGAYRITYQNAPEKVLLTTHEVAPGAWDVVPAH
jgi:hypothetical protein